MAKPTSDTLYDYKIALIGNPNVGKSSVFNALTGLHQHTGNWPGKTVDSAFGSYTYSGKRYLLTDLPGTYSLLPHSAEEEVARDYLVLEKPDAAIIVCDASCLERNLNLVLQTLEITRRAVVCVNLLDEAARRGITVNLKKLSKRLGIPVVGTVARAGKGLSELMEAVNSVLKKEPSCYLPRYTHAIEEAISSLTPYFSNIENPRWTALRLLEEDDVIHKLDGFQLTQKLSMAASLSREAVLSSGTASVCDSIVSCIVLGAEEICLGIVKTKKGGKTERDRKIDRIVTSRLFGIPIMIGLLALVFWLTAFGANLPSAALSSIFAWLEELLISAALRVGVPEIIYSPLIFGVYHVLTWVISVMLPPMAIFFPLFTLLEDLGYLPRIAFNLDKCFKKCSACGKQALTM